MKKKGGKSLDEHCHIDSGRKSNMGQKSTKTIEHYNGPAYILQTPPELLTEIVVYLDPKQILQLSRVCKIFRDAIIKYDEVIWKQRLEAVFSEISTNTKLHTISDYMSEANIKVSDVYALNWKCIFFYVKNGVFRFNSLDACKEIFISPDRTSVVTGKNPAEGHITHGEFRILLLQPGIPRDSQRIFQVSIRVDEFGTGLWLGVSRKNFKNHTWLGSEEDSWGWGNNCTDFYWNYNGKQGRQATTDLKNFSTGDIVSMKVDMSAKTLQYFKNGNPGILLDLNNIPGEDDLHFAVDLFGYNNSMQVTLHPDNKHHV